jgi:UDP-2,4-diacetamido-2,4,6-trideoxy-beta-L-altropyranose hydrolase
MSKLRIAICTHGGPGIGLGHVQRCLTLAQAVARMGAQVTFVVNDNPSVLACIERKSFEVVGISEGIEWPAVSLQVLAKRHIHVLVADSYDIGTDYLEIARQHIGALIAIDDLADRQLPVDIVVNAAVGAETLPYSRLTSGRLLLGPAYSLLRDEFACEPERSVRPVVERILITVGGSDVQNLTPRLIKWTRQVLPSVVLDVVIGPFFTDEPNVADDKIILYRDPQNMRDLMLRCDLALCSGGQTTYELAATGTPALAVQIADNQSANLIGMSAAGTLVRAGDVHDAGLEIYFKRMLSVVSDMGRRLAMSACGRALVDGQGAQRVARAIVKLAAHG